MSYDIFISYSSRDSDVAQSVCKTLEDSGKKCWIAPRDITPGSDWAEAILAGISECRVMVLIFSANANISPQIKREVERAVNRSMPILPFKIDPTHPSGSFEFFIMNSHWLDASAPPLESHFRSLVQSIDSLLSLEPSDNLPDTRHSDSFVSRALAHCRAYESQFSRIGSFDNSSDFLRDDFGLSRTTCDLDSDRESRNSPNPFAPPPLFTDVDLIDQLASKKRNRLWVLGGGGIGKTELSKLIARKLSTDFIKDSSVGVVPLLIELKSLDPTLPCNSVSRLLNDHFAPDEMVWLQRYLNEGRVAFILDGMDELRLDRNSFVSTLTKLIKKHSQCAFVVAGRGDSIDPELSNPTCFARENVHILKPLYLDQAKDYIASFFKLCGQEAKAEEIQEQIASNSRLSQMICDSPLLLSMACEVFRHDQTLTTNPVDLMERGLSVVFERRRRRHSSNVSDGELPEDKSCIAALACLAAHAFEKQLSTNSGAISFSRQEAIQWLLQNSDKLRFAGLKITSENDARQMLIVQALHSGVIGWASPNTIEIGHRVIAEYLTAYWVLNFGYPNWPYRENSHSSNCPNLDRQILDFYSDVFWSINYRGLRDWLCYSLAKYNRELLRRFYEWCTVSVAEANNLLPVKNYVPDEWHTAKLPALISAVIALRNLEIHDLADDLFDDLVEKIGLSTTARYVSQQVILEATSERKLNESLKYCYSRSNDSGELSKMAYIVMPHVSKWLRAYKDKDGNPIGSETGWTVSKSMSLGLILPNLKCKPSYSECYLLDVANRLSIPESCERLLTDCILDENVKGLEFRLLDVLYYLVSQPSLPRSFEYTLEQLLDRKKSIDCVELNFVEAMLMLIAHSKSSRDLCSCIERLFLSRCLHNLEGQFQHSLRILFILATTNNKQIKEICDTPNIMRVSAILDRKSTTLLAEQIGCSIADWATTDDSTKQLHLVELYRLHDARKPLAENIELGPIGSEYAECVADVVESALRANFWNDNGPNVKFLKWLRRADKSRFDSICGDAVFEAKQELSSEEPDLVMRIHEAKKVRELIDSQPEFKSKLEQVLLEAKKAKGTAVSNENQPNLEGTRTRALSMLQDHKGKSLVDAADVIKLAARNWPDDSEVRLSCVELVVESVDSAGHRSILEKACEALVEGWPGDQEVLRQVVEAGLGSVIGKSPSWFPWVMFWEPDDSSVWLPDCKSSFERVPINLGSDSGALLVCPREDLRRGLPAELLKGDR